MTVAELLDQAKALSYTERKDLAKLLIDTLDVDEPATPARTGAEIVAMLEAMDEPVELVDPHIEDPIKWVEAQRQKRQDKLKPYWDGEA